MPGQVGWPRRCACRALQTARKCTGSSSSELQSSHIGFPVGLPSLLTLNLAASLSRSWQPRTSLTLKLDLVVRCSKSAEWVIFQCGAGAPAGLVQHRVMGLRSLLLSASSSRFNCEWHAISLPMHLDPDACRGGVGYKCGNVRLSTSRWCCIELVQDLGNDELGRASRICLGAAWSGRRSIECKKISLSFRMMSLMFFAPTIQSTSVLGHLIGSPWIVRKIFRCTLSNISISVLEIFHSHAPYNMRGKLKAW